MSQTWIVIGISVAYLGVLFAIAFCGDRRASSGRSIIGRGTVYALSLSVYATSWTYYGSVGRAAETGVGFLPIYLGPTIMLAAGWLVLRRIVRICRRHRVTSLADFVSARYGKSVALGSLVTVIAVVGVIPYIALQLKAVSTTFEIIRRAPVASSESALTSAPLYQDTALYVALLLAGFTILFGTRHLDATERHEGMVIAIAFESVVKLVAFVSAGVAVTWGLHDGFGDLFAKAADAGLTQVFGLGDSSGTWIWLTVLSAFAILLLPRQWQVGVVENVDERHVKQAMWLTPLYMAVISLFVLPIAAAGLLRFGPGSDADTYVLTLPMAAGMDLLTILVFIGGLSAATGMIIVETVALSTMVSNSIVVPILLKMSYRGDLARLIQFSRRASIVIVMLLGYTYFRFAGGSAALASMGLISFAAVAQFAPAILGGLFWKGGTRNGVLTGLVGGVVVWAYTLLVPSFAAVGWLSRGFLDDGPFGIRALRPEHLLGVTGMDNISHGMFWSMVLNVGCYVLVSLLSKQNPREQAQAVQFVDALEEPAQLALPRKRIVPVSSLYQVVSRAVGSGVADRTFAAVDTDPRSEENADAALLRHVETVLAGAVGAASAQMVMTEVAGEEQLGVVAVMEMIDEAAQVAMLEERTRLARDLHDSVSQGLFSMTLHARAVELALKREGVDENGSVARGIRELRSLTQGALMEMRASLFQLRPNALREDGLAEAVRKQSAAIASREGVAIAVEGPGYRLSLAESAETELFRVVQEAVHNSIKHARPDRINILIEEVHGNVLIEVVDDGTGFDPAAVSTGGMGLTGMRERVQRIGGELEVDSSPEGSTTVRVTISTTPDGQG
ncbi:Histidine kinase-, DNA gyrase B-, and HSP90-like ATPase [Lentzea waywayandensis]|uniref:Histidine kinase-, DNA gyrase B-, and HSP90-like ATPase n=1 Tax=Lentzea waywayandensis TaxID=84724 RepID=A0A1I6D3W1_9PSEU|nr:ATP-binding protein [Lentzea waywayandensis]SFR00032.1 Histidine kinase-, DNA gyrase B-, and HSP90-like ATPase [Lentzea waywayandensis]